MNHTDQSERIEGARKLREQLLADPWRPGYHFAIPEDIGRPGDPNGAFFANGRYHLMYLYDRRGMHGFSNQGFCWGHISSHDLVHWRHHPDAIVPGDGDSGCFSGGAFVDDDGTAYLSYWRLPKNKEDGSGHGIGIAKSNDEHYEVWEKMRVPSLDGTEFGIQELRDESGEVISVGCADPSNIWKKDGVYYLEAGNLLVLSKFGRNEDSPEELKTAARQEYNAVNAQRKILLSNHKKLKEKNDSLTEEIIGMRARYEEVEADRQSLSTALEHERIHAESLTKNIENLYADAEAKESAKQEMQKEMTELKDRFQRMEEELESRRQSESVSDVTSLEEHMKEIKTEIEVKQNSLTTVLTELNDLYRSLSEEREKKSQLSEAESRIYAIVGKPGSGKKRKVERETSVDLKDVHVVMEIESSDSEKSSQRLQTLNSQIAGIDKILSTVDSTNAEKIAELNKKKNELQKKQAQQQKLVN